jgi:hypothetical protein
MFAAEDTFLDGVVACGRVEGMSAQIRVATPMIDALCGGLQAWVASLSSGDAGAVARAVCELLEALKSEPEKYAEEALIQGTAAR